MIFTAEQLQTNFDNLLAIVDKYIQEPRAEALKQLYNDHAERIMLMPAASIDHHHNTFPGGYVDHVIRVTNCALQIKKLWEASGALINYTDEELVFAALNHDLGKIGTEEAEQYILNESEWHRKNQGKIYNHNPVNAFMLVPDRSLFLLQQRGIKVSANEYLGIRIHDGLYDESNKAYYMSHSKDSKLRTNLPIILHHADHMAARIEYEAWNASQSKTVSAIKNSKSSQNISETDKSELANIFHNLF